MAVFQLGNLMVKKLISLRVKCWVLLILTKLKEKIVVSKVHHLVYLSDMLEAYLKIPRFSLMKSASNAVHLEHMNDILKESKGYLSLD